jgi:valyl-tRNA synthetase
MLKVIIFLFRTSDVIEPLVKPQWWVNCKDVAARAIDDAKTGKLRILPDFQKVLWYEFLEKIRDWCISRQLWWGHRCPAYLVQVKVTYIITKGYY